LGERDETEVAGFDMAQASKPEQWKGLSSEVNEVVNWILPPILDLVRLRLSRLYRRPHHSLVDDRDPLSSSDDGQIVIFKAA
jgi:hypothetical protein